MDNKKAVAAAVAATIAASAGAVEASFDSPADLLQDNSTEPKIEYVDMGQVQDDDSMQDEEKQKPQTRSGAFREWILSLPLAVRTVFVLPFWAAGSLLAYGADFLLAASSPILHWIAGFLLLALIIAGAFTATAKAIFPDLPLKKIFNRHSIKWILITSAAVYAADLILGAVWADYAHFKALVMAGFLLAAILSIVIWFSRREMRRRTSLCEEEPEIAEKEELVYTSLGQTFTIRPGREKQ